MDATAADRQGLRDSAKIREGRGISGALGIGSSSNSSSIVYRPSSFRPPIHLTTSIPTPSTTPLRLVEPARPTGQDSDSDSDSESNADAQVDETMEWNPLLLRDVTKSLVVCTCSLLIVLPAPC